MPRLPDRPFKSAVLLLRLLAGRDRSPAFLGDLEEEFAAAAAAGGLARAHRHFGRLALVSLPSILLDRLHWRLVMFTNYFKILVRGIRRQPVFSLINIAGLAMGIGLCLVLTLYIQFESSFDDFHPAADRIFRIAVEQTMAGGKKSYARITDAMGPALPASLPQIEAVGRWQRITPKTVRSGDVFATEDLMAFADQSVFDLFRFRFLEGDPGRALARPGTVVLTRSLARKYFGRTPPLGRLLRVDDVELEVTAVIADPPANTHFKASLLRTMIDRDADVRHSGWNPGLGPCYTYVRLRPGADLAAVTGQVNAIALHNNAEALRQQGLNDRFFLQPLRDLHLRSRLEAEAEPAGDPQYLVLFGLVGLLVLLVACVNFISLSTARFADRAREVGIRKVVGAHRAQLAGQFLSESFVLAAFSAVIAVLALQAIVPAMNRWLGTALAASRLFSPGFLLGLGGCVVLAGWVAGAYPALLLSSLRPGSMLKGRAKAGGRASSLRRILVIGQFAVSAVLIIGTLVTARQIGYMKNKNLGFRKERQLIVQLPTRSRPRMVGIDEGKAANIETVKAEFRKLPFVSGAAASTSLPGRGVAPWDIWRPGKRSEKRPIFQMSVDADFLGLYGIMIVARRADARDVPAKPEAGRFGFYINEKAVRALGFSAPEEALGQEFFENRAWVQGVVRDFHFAGLQSEIGPLIIFISPGIRYLTLNLKTERLKDGLRSAEGVFHRFYPSEVFEYFFLDDDFNRQYQAEERVGRLAVTFAGLGVLIACLGLFGLASYSTSQKAKEIGIRKVLGATVGDVVLLHSREFMKGVVGANLLAWPVAYWAMGRWLRSFAYRTSLGPDIFLLAAGLTLVIALATISARVAKAAMADPAEALRTE